MSFTENTSVQARTLTAFFDTKEAAQKAVADIEAAGLPRQHVSLVEGAAATGTAEASPDHGGVLQSLKDMLMPEEDRYAYTEGLRRGGYLVSVNTDEANYNRVLDILDRDGAVDMDQRESSWRQEGWSGYQAGSAAGLGLASSAAAVTARDAIPTTATTSAAGAVTAGEGEVIPVYAEQLTVGKREVSQGRTRVRSYVVETPVNEQVSLRTESVQIDRRPVDRPVSAADAAFEDRVIEVEEFAEEAVISKQARVTEEISLRKEVRDRTETVSDTVRHTEVEIEDGRGGAATTGGLRAVAEGSDGGRIVPHMDVIASDGTKVGTVDHMDGTDTIKLAKDTSPDGQHHHVPVAWVDHVDQHVHLNRSAADVKAGW